MPIPPRPSSRSIEYRPASANWNGKEHLIDGWAGLGAIRQYAIYCVARLRPRVLCVVHIIESRVLEPLARGR